VPPGFDAAEAFALADKEIELVVVHPNAKAIETLDLAMDDRGRYRKAGGILVTVRRRGGAGGGQADLAAVRRDHSPKGLEPAELIEDLPGWALPGVVAYHSDGREEYFLMGRYCVYAVVGAPGARSVGAVAASIREVSPRAHVGGFLRESVGPDRSSLYLHAETGLRFKLPPGYERAEPVVQRQVYYGFAFRHPDGFEGRVQYLPSPARELGPAYLKAVAFNMGAAPGVAVLPDPAFEPQDKDLLESLFRAERGWLSTPFDLPAGSEFVGGGPYRVGMLQTIARADEGGFITMYLAKDREVLLKHLQVLDLMTLVTFRRAKAP